MVVVQLVVLHSWFPTWKRPRVTNPWLHLEHSNQNHVCRNALTMGIAELVPCFAYSCFVIFSFSF
jgi:hypothetical protein